MSIRRSNSKSTGSKTSPRKRAKRTSTKIMSKQGYTFDEFKAIEDELPRQYDAFPSKARDFVHIIDKKVKPKIPNAYNLRTVKVQYIPYSQGNSVLMNGVVIGRDASHLVGRNTSDYLKEYTEIIDDTPNPNDYHFWSGNLYNLYQTEEIRTSGQIPSSSMPVSSNDWDIQMFENAGERMDDIVYRIKKLRDTHTKSSREYKMLNKVYKGANKDLDMIKDKEKRSKTLRTNQRSQKVDHAINTVKKQYKQQPVTWIRAMLKEKNFSHTEIETIMKKSKRHKK